MTRRKPDGDGGSFADAVGDVKPIEGRDKIRTPSKPASPRATAVQAPTRSFVIERDGDWTFARAEDVAAARLADLRAGRIAAEREIDLHGYLAADAESVLHDALQQARAAGARCVLVIHGWGRHSSQGPVLKDALPDWLTATPLAADVLAFATAPRTQGGPGATLVWLRRVRRG